MSWDIYLTAPACDHCGAEARTVYEGNYTHNMNGAIRSAWDGKCWNEVNGQRAEDLLPGLLVAIGRMQRDPAAFRRYEPGNGWGTVESCILFLRGIADAMQKHPRAIVEASG